MLKILIGKSDVAKGIHTGLNTIFYMVNEHLNDKKERELKDAEIRVKNAEAAKLQAEAEKINAETELLKKQGQGSEPELKTNRDGQLMFNTTPQLKLVDLTVPSEAEVKACIVPIATSCVRCANAAKANGIYTGLK